MKLKEYMAIRFRNGKTRALSNKELEIFGFGYTTGWFKRNKDNEYPIQTILRAAESVFEGTNVNNNVKNRLKKFIKAVKENPQNYLTPTSTPCNMCNIKSNGGNKMTKQTLTLEAGKTYVFKDEAAKQAWLNELDINQSILNDCYKDGFTIDDVWSTGSGYIKCVCVIGPDERNFFKLKEEPVKNIKPEDEVTITTTYGELARAYAILGDVNGLGYGGHLWNELHKILDPEMNIHCEIIGSKSYNELMDYSSYQKEWINALFPQETEQQKQARQLREQAEELLKKAKALEESI